MKMSLKLIIPIIAVLLLSGFTSEKKEKKEKKTIDGFALVDSKSFVFDAQSMTSQKGAHRSLTSSYDLTIKGDTAIAYLPFVGRAYSGAYGGDGAIEFDGDMQDYKVELKEKKKEKNDQKVVSFVVKGNNDTYTCRLSVSRSGNASLTVTSNNRQAMSFNGQIKAIMEEK